MAPREEGDDLCATGGPGFPGPTRRALRDALCWFAFGRFEGKPKGTAFGVQLLS